MQESDPLLGSLAGPNSSRPRSAAEGEESGVEEEEEEEGDHMEVVASGLGDLPSHHHHRSTAADDPADPSHSDLDRISSSTSSLSLSSKCAEHL